MNLGDRKVSVEVSMLLLEAVAADPSAGAMQMMASLAYDRPLTWTSRARGQVTAEVPLDAGLDAWDVFARADAALRSALSLGPVDVTPPPAMHQPLTVEPSRSDVEDAVALRRALVEIAGYATGRGRYDAHDALVRIARIAEHALT